MKISVTVVYGSDGEVMSVIGEVKDPDAGAEEIADIIGTIADRIRTQVRIEAAPAVRANEADACQRTLCGHGRNVHTDYDDEGVMVGQGNGRCAVCGAGKCRSFVGKAEPAVVPTAFSGPYVTDGVIKP